MHCLCVPAWPRPQSTPQHPPPQLCEMETQSHWLTISICTTCPLLPLLVARISSSKLCTQQSRPSEPPAVLEAIAHQPPCFAIWWRWSRLSRPAPTSPSIPSQALLCLALWHLGQTMEQLKWALPPLAMELLVQRMSRTRPPRSSTPATLASKHVARRTALSHNQ